ncbi:GNAT family N-acetyltransferase [Streptomyces sp. NPDC054961]
MGRRRPRRPAGPDPRRRQEVARGGSAPARPSRGAIHPCGGTRGREDRRSPRPAAPLSSVAMEPRGDTAPGRVRLREPEPGELGWIVQRHGALYSAEYGWNAEFEGLVARIVADFALDHDPHLERVWIAELDGLPVGSVMCVREDGAPGTARLRLLLVDPAGRGHGIGARLVAAVIAFARSAGYRELVLWTNDVLTSARSLYQHAGFTLVSEHPHRSYGVTLTGQDWRLPLRENL